MASSSKRSFKTKENLKGNHKLFKYALQRKKPKWRFLLRKNPQDFSFVELPPKLSLYQSSLPISEGSRPRPLQRLSRQFAIEWDTRQKFKSFYHIPRISLWNRFAKLSLRPDGNYKSNIRSKLSHRLLNFLALFERRLDISLYRSLLLPSIPSARQHILSGSIRVNSKIVKSHSYLLRSGDLVEIVLPQKQEDSLRKSIIERIDSLKNLFYPHSRRPKLDPTFFMPPSHLEVKKSMLIFIFVDKPQIIETTYPFPIHIHNLPIHLSVLTSLYLHTYFYYILLY